MTSSSNKLQFVKIYQHTLESGINIGPRLLIFGIFSFGYVQQGLEIHGLEEHGPWRYTVFNWISKHLRYTVLGQKPWRCTVFLRYMDFDQKPWRCTVFSFDVLDGKKVSTQHQPYNWLVSERSICGKIVTYWVWASGTIQMRCLDFHLYRYTN